ncbi:GNAT family N-acetyltransferase [Flavobacterium luminosum]|uniref:GNAT family N-acetyltransferase n=1 Tax=Flavobacterium luminosum TaxID=2949086 RepID=A0ABT0TKP0_9FLAO|nr:GNAT family N-acetyltransferase [Flavobacterium sp. HXWNR70]MCL9808027.1 GNAT family N-acetyltransferase [Flavobacterium sp. HXWNR70]
MIEIKKITATETYAVRQPVLRPGKPIESCQFEGDDLKTTTHFGLFKEQTLIGVVSVFEVTHKDFEAKKQFQVRGMAILENEQNKGYGNLLITEVEKLAHKNKIEIIWFNAREKAVNFYQKMGYTILGTLFDIPNVGPHYVMWKQL